MPEDRARLASQSTSRNGEPEPTSSSLAALLWRGAALATLFLYPLVSGLSDSPFEFQWRPEDTLELGFTFSGLSLAGAVALYGIERIRRPRLAIAAALTLCALPFASFATQILRQLGARWLGGLVESPDATGVGALAAIATLGLAALALAFRHPVPARKALEIAVLVISPLTLVSAFTVARQTLDPFTVATTSPPTSAAGSQSASDLADVFVFVFDELDYDFLYRDEVIRGEFPNLRELAEISDNHHRALSPGPMTLSSMPGLLMGSARTKVDTRVSRGVYRARIRGQLQPVDFSVGNIFQKAHWRGYRTVMIGWALPYCEMMPGSLDECRSFANYNYSSAVDSFSPHGPILTTMILLPFQRPFGFLKSAGFVPHQRNMVEATYELTIAALSDPAPLFLMAHFSIPHAPFVFDTDRYSPADNPFALTAASYEAQLRYVDHLVGGLLDALKSHGRFAEASVIVVSDHAYRSLKPKARHREIPMIVKRPHQTTIRDIFSPTHSETLLEEVVTGE